jgi:tRNA(fMet)-specific endonuclease VapC
MARFLLDTNMCIYLMKNQPPQVAERFASCYVGDVIMSSITLAELEFGVLMSANPIREQQNLAALIEDLPVAAFDRAAATAYGPVHLATRDRKKDYLDKLIAAHAISLNVILVTNNESDFTHYPDLRVEN